MTTDVTAATVRLDLSAEDVARLKALAMFGATFVSGESLRAWCDAFWRRLLPLQMSLEAATTTENGER